MKGYKPASNASLTSENVELFQCLIFRFKQFPICHLNDDLE